jgi:glucose/arabinose dehydrogenase
MNRQSMIYLSIVLMVGLMVILISSCTAPEVGTPDGEAEEMVTEESEDVPGEPVEVSAGLAPGADQVEYRFKPQEIFQGTTFNRPLLVRGAGDGSGRLFVVEQGGQIYVLSGSEADDKELFLDIRNLIDDSGNEMGLLGLAFHPDYTENGQFFVNYTDSSGTVIARFETVGGRGDPDSLDVILSFDQPYSNHNGGHLEFGPDGYLYIATGDGGSGGDPLGHAQNRQTFHGNILRIDIDSRGPQGSYAIPPDNPFAGNSEGYLEEIYAYGLRNPWRFSFDPLTGLLWAGDVGQNAVEEINIIEKGKNYGWNIMEGSQCFNPPTGCDSTGLAMPVYEYLHPLGRSITGGYVYRGSELPLLEGAYVYADFVSGLIWALWYQEGEVQTNYTIADTNLMISSFGEDDNHELYFTAFDGRVYKLTYN